MEFELSDISSALTEGLAAFQAATDADSLEEARREYVGSKGIVKKLLASIKDVPQEQRSEYGKAANRMSNGLQKAYQTARQRLSGAPASAPDGIDLTLPGASRELGHAHVLTQTVEEIIEIFGRLGFAVAEGPEVEDEAHNFDALNIPKGHPARAEGDNFFLQLTAPDWEARPMPLLLRSQTSTIQIRCMETQEPPVRIVAPGRVYRPDTVDATHHYMFHQIEGLAVDTDLTFGDLKSVLELFVREFFGEDTRMRFRPHYFPFTEPSAEVDIDCQMFKHLKKPWLEVLGCGMVDPNVLEAVGYDSKKYTGFAFGMGVERIAMLKHGIGDIRNFITNDMRFLRQF